MALNLKKPHGLISGITADGARYKQGGHRYRADGTPCDGSKVQESPQVPELPVEPEKEPTMSGDQIDWNNVHHMVLKKMMKDDGKEYIDREEAVAWLRDGVDTTAP